MSHTDPNHDVPCDEACGAYKEALATENDQLRRRIAEMEARPTSEAVREALAWIDSSVRCRRSSCDGCLPSHVICVSRSNREAIATLTAATHPTVPTKDAVFAALLTCRDECERDMDRSDACESCAVNKSGLYPDCPMRFESERTVPQEVVEAWDALWKELPYLWSNGSIHQSERAATIDRFIRGEATDADE